MPATIPSLDATPPFVPLVALQGMAGRRDATAPLGTLVFARSAGRVRPNARVYRPGPGPGQPPDPDRLWRWLCKAAAWLLELAIDGFAQYANAMHPGFYDPEQVGHGGRTGTEPPCVGHEDSILVFRDGAAATPEIFTGSKMTCAVAPNRRTRMTVRLGRLAARWQREADARRQAELLGTLSDHLLRDIGIARDQIDSLARHDWYFD